MELRPLGFGEIFDRAVTLYVKNFVPFAGIVMVLVVPIAIFQYVIDRGSQAQFDVMVRVFRHPEISRTEQIPSMFNSPGMIAVFIALVLLVYVVSPFVLNAVAVGVARLYRGRPVEFRACYQAVLVRWKQLLQLMVVEFLVLLGWYILTVTIAVLVVLAAVLMGMAVPRLALMLGIGAGLIVFFLMLPLLAPLLVALSFAMYSVVIEERAVVESFVSGFGRVFNRVEFWRALLFAIAAGAIVFGASTMFSLLGLTLAYFHQPGLRAIVDSLPQAIISPFAIVLFSIYYFDVRIRHEAYDLETSLERLTAAQPA